MTSIIHLSVPAGAYRNITEAYKEANAIKKYIQYHYKIDETYYNITIAVSNIKPSIAEYVCVPRGKGRPPRAVSSKNIDKAYVEPHLHIIITALNKGNTIANSIISYLMKRHQSAKKENYCLHVYKKKVTQTPEVVLRYILKQAKYIVTIKPLKKSNRNSIANDFKYNITIINCLIDIANDIVLYEDAKCMKQFRDYINYQMYRYCSVANISEDLFVSGLCCLDYICYQTRKYYRHIMNAQEKLLFVEAELRYFCRESCI